MGSTTIVYKHKVKDNLKEGYKHLLRWKDAKCIAMCIFHHLTLKIKENELGWRADEDFDRGIVKSVEWYLEKYKGCIE
jgi:hypothetical protein